MAGVVGRHPSDDTWLLPFSFYDNERPEQYIYDPEVANKWYWEPQGNESAYYVEIA